MSKDNGGPAFPCDRRAEVDRGWWQSGISVRDYFAAKAMQAYFTDPNVGFNSDTIKDGCKAAYKIADAMIAERNKQ